MKDVFIIGAGRVGLPLGLVLAKAGLTVTLHDTDGARVKKIKEGQMPFLEAGAQEILKEVLHEKLFVADDISQVEDHAYIVITIGTPLDEYLNPRLDKIFKVADELKPYLKDQCIILRSTVFPGTTRRFASYIEQKVPVAFCPERIVEGKAIEELGGIPQIVGGHTLYARNRAAELFEKLGPVIRLADTIDAELAKLFSNAYRYAQFALANQFYMICDQAGADFHSIREAMMEDYPRMRDFPRAGFAAGPCLMKDTMQLCAFDQTHFQLGQASRDTNEGLPNHIVQKIVRQMPIAGKKVGILGMSFKSDLDDPRDSLSYKLRKLFQFEGAQVLCTDEFIQDPSFVSKEEVSTCPIIIEATPHSAYKNLNIPAHADWYEAPFGGA